jgi:hypothetical protein
MKYSSTPLDSFYGLPPMRGGKTYTEYLDVTAVVQRARRMLSGRSDQQAHTIASAIEWMIDEFFKEQEEDEIRRQAGPNGTLWRYLPSGTEPTVGNIRWLFNDVGLSVDAKLETAHMTPENTSELTALQECISGYVVSNDEEVPDASEFEYFAVLSLKLAGRALDYVAAIDEKTDEFDFKRYLRFATDLAMDATDAAAYAERLRAEGDDKRELDMLKKWAVKRTEENNLLRETIRTLERSQEERATELARERISVNNSKAAIKRHAENHELKRAALDYYEKHKHRFPSTEAAAEEIAKRVVPVKHRTVVTWISQHNKRDRGHPPE